ncbi:hypothetical protein [Bradyrhizobium sp. SZCCHNRI3052]|uniref:hypothetical protein n=1 Tax=Bradyrhizobium sp. SZCCHNRI3052 TaxID=3057295 RepID=UPI002916075E|nr:hypothetical protein [Bradyrhizobium sp. SZCCHNRI3052]
MTNKHKECFYCGGLVAERSGQGDHFPIPDRNGGLETVPCCVSCHDMKDRFTLENWPMDWLYKVLADFPKLSRETRIFLAKTMAIASDLKQERMRPNA